MSLHCIGMCGPILIGFSQVFKQVAPTLEGKRIERSRWRVVWEFGWYHLGRIWTYALLGFAAGWVGAGVRHSAAVMGWHRAAGVVIGVAVILSGILLLGIIPGLKVSALVDGCALKQWSAWRWFNALLRSRGAAPRLLLGVVMGFLPCGLVYAMLAVVAALPTPWHAAFGMTVFGIGTLPSLTVVMAAVHLVPIRLRANGTRVAAVMVVLTGIWMTVRASLPHEHAAEHTTHSQIATQDDHHL